MPKTVTHVVAQPVTYVVALDSAVPLQLFIDGIFLDVIFLSHRIIRNLNHLPIREDLLLALPLMPAVFTLPFSLEEGQRKAENQP